mmetsp:Transcript_84969/g.216452  ORF Transcript_84969/g.216452 Transcript_84969/m.216452 type:complete len:215 (-) Transcript_84969:82-726(-)
MLVVRLLQGAARCQHLGHEGFVAVQGLLGRLLVVFGLHDVDLQLGRALQLRFDARTQGLRLLAACGDECVDVHLSLLLVLGRLREVVLEGRLHLLQNANDLVARKALAIVCLLAILQKSLQCFSGLAVDLVAGHQLMEHACLFCLQEHGLSSGGDADGQGFDSLAQRTDVCLVLGRLLPEGGRLLFSHRLRFRDLLVNDYALLLHRLNLVLDPG